MAAKLQCEICGGRLIGKPGGIFECENCGTEFSTEWAKAKLQEITGTVKVEGTVEVQGKVQVEGPVKIEGPVKVENTVTIENLIKRGNMELNEENWSRAQEVFDQALNIDAENVDAKLGLLFAKRRDNKKALEQMSYDAARYRSLRTDPAFLRIKAQAKSDFPEWLVRLETKFNQMKAEQQRKEKETEDQNNSQMRRAVAITLERVKKALQNSDTVLQMLKSEKETLEQQRGSLGFFAVKEKRKIDEQMSQIDTSYENESARNRPLASALKSLTQIATTIGISKDVEAKSQEKNADKLVSIGELANPAGLKQIHSLAPTLFLDLYAAGLEETVFFGEYLATQSVTRPISWLPLQKSDGTVMLISKYALECKEFTEKSGNIGDTWEDSSLRWWLNGRFLNQAFTADEKSRLCERKLPGEKSPKSAARISAFTTDKVFLLSEAEVKRFFPQEDARICEQTYFAANHDDYIPKMPGPCSWWLRSPGTRSICDIKTVNKNGSIQDSSSTNKYVGVRPVIVLKLD